MSTKCIVCEHELCEQITHEIFSGVPYRRISEKYHISLGALSRHKTHTATQTAAVAAQNGTALAPVQIDNGIIMSRLATLNENAEKIYKRTFKKGDDLNAIRALKELRGILELYARLTGELNQQQTIVHQHLHVDPEWITLRNRMLKALEPYPEARAALIDAIGGLNDD